MAIASWQPLGSFFVVIDGRSVFSRSPSKRWVIDEGHGKPCLIDTRTSTEELLGATNEGKFMPAYGNEPLTHDCHWHSR